MFSKTRRGVGKHQDNWLYETNQTDEATTQECYFFCFLKYWILHFKMNRQAFKFFFRKKKNQKQETSMHDILNPLPFFFAVLKIIMKRRINLPKTKHHHNRYWRDYLLLLSFHFCLLLLISKVVADFGKVEIFSSTTAVDVEYIETSCFEMSGSVVRLGNE